MVLKNLNCLNTNKLAGPGGIYPRILQEVNREIVDALCIIFNESIIRPTYWTDLMDSQPDHFSFAHRFRFSF